MILPCDVSDFGAKPITSAPPNWWWIIISGIKALMELINLIFIKLQAPDLLVSVQVELLDSLMVDISLGFLVGRLERALSLGNCV